MSLSPAALEALRAAQSAFSTTEADVFEDALARGLEAVDGEGRIVGAFQAQTLERLTARVAELEAERHSTNKALSKAMERLAELEALTPAAIQTCRKCGAGYTYGEPCSNCLFRAEMAAEMALRTSTGGA